MRWKSGKSISPVTPETGGARQDFRFAGGAFLHNVGVDGFTGINSFASDAAAPPFR
ncbi:MAG: hypothetical protein R3A10_01295 [Caldilineaceae bacterium]